jgi:16S rRNA (adenine1518-N6/adenine1519-N6)-dimethyltransferase
MSAPDAPRDAVRPTAVGTTPFLLPTARRDWVALLNRLGVRPSKGLGQNFLYERGLVQRMVKAAGIGPDDHVVEVGPGLGILTEELLRRADSVTAVELDRRLAAHLRAALGHLPHFRLVEGNALEVPIAELVPDGRPYAVAANLPYAVATPVLRRFLEERHKPRRLTLMFQREVAERLVARPPDLTILGVAAQFYAEARIAFPVAPSVFIPPPSVESAVAILDVRPDPPLPESLRPLFFRIVNAGFRQKRKQVANSLAAELDLPKDRVTAWLETAGIDPMRRAQTLDIAEWVRLTETAPPIGAGVATPAAEDLS